jgi:hypothetical protein
MNRETTDVLPTETLAHIQSAGCKAQKKSVIGAHNRCWKYLIGAISTHGEAARDLEFIGGDKDKQLGKLWAETRLEDILPWDEIADEAERLLESDQATRRAPANDQADKEQEGDQEVDRDETDTHMETPLPQRALHPTDHVRQETHPTYNPPQSARKNGAGEISSFIFSKNRVPYVTSNRYYAPTNNNASAKQSTYAQLA